MRDLLGLDVDVNAYLPPDTISHGFDNVADVQSLSPTLMEGYLRAASQISRLAVGDRTATADVGHLQDPARHVADARTSKARRSARAAACPRCTSSRPTANTSSRSRMHYEPLGGLIGRSTMSDVRL